MAGHRNLAPERGPSVWNRPEWSPGGGLQHRWLQGLGGAAIAVTGAALAAVGGSMIYRAAARRGGSTPIDSEPAAVPLQARRLEDVVSRESADSFPASDAPSWTPTMGATSGATE